MLKKLLIALTLLTSSTIFADTQSLNVEINDSKAIERHYYYFGMVPVNFRSFINYRVTNTGTIPLVFQRAIVGGASFHAQHNCKGVLNPGARCQFTVEFSPFFEGYQVGYFRLSFDQGYEILLDLSGDARR